MTTPTHAWLDDAKHEIIRAWCAPRGIPAPTNGDCMALVAALTAPTRLDHFIEDVEASGDATKNAAESFGETILRDIRWRIDDIRDMLMKQNGRGDRIYGCDEWSTPVVNLQTAIAVIDAALKSQRAAAINPDLMGGK